MKPLFFKKSLVSFSMLMPILLFAQDFQGKAYYFSKSTMELGSFGAKFWQNITYLANK